MFGLGRIVIKFLSKGSVFLPAGEYTATIQKIEKTTPDTVTITLCKVSKV